MTEHIAGSPRNDKDDGKSRRVASKMYENVSDRRTTVNQMSNNVYRLKTEEESATRSAYDHQPHKPFIAHAKSAGISETTGAAVNNPERLTGQHHIGKPDRPERTGGRLQSLRELRTMQTPGSGYFCRLALHDVNSVFVCTNGRLYRYDGKTWADISRRYKTEDKAWDVCLHNDTLVVSKKSEQGQRVQLIVGDINTTRHTTIQLPFISYDPAIACGRPVHDQPTYYALEWSGKRAVHHIDHTGNIIQTYGMGELTNPCDVAVDVDGDLVVADWHRKDVIMYNPDGSVKRCLRQHNHLHNYQLLDVSPESVCVDGNGYIFVASSYTDSILLFSPIGDYIRTVLAKKDGISSPTGLAVSTCGHLAVVSGLSNKTKIYKYYSEHVERMKTVGVGIERIDTNSKITTEDSTELSTATLQMDEIPSDAVKHICGHDGGVFTCDGSDTEISVPLGAVKETEAVEIVQRTICNVHVYRDKFNLTPDQDFISPIFDLSYQEGFHRFEKPVTITLPVCRIFPTDDVQIYCYRDGAVIRIPTRDSKIKQATFFVVDKEVIKISTWQFSKFYACTCSTTNEELKLKAYIYAKTRQTHTCVLRVYLCDERHSMPDFSNALDQEEGKSNFHRIHHERINLLNGVLPEDKISAVFHSSIWMENGKSSNCSHTSAKEHTVGELIDCQRGPQELGTWSLMRRNQEDEIISTLRIVREQDERIEQSTIYIAENIDGELIDCQRGVKEQGTWSLIRRNQEDEIMSTLRIDHQQGERIEPSIIHIANEDLEGDQKRVQSKPTSVRSSLKSVTEHSRLMLHIINRIYRESEDFQKLKVAADPYLKNGTVESCRNTKEILDKLTKQGIIRVGEYTILKEIFQSIGDMALHEEICKREAIITEERSKSLN